MHRACGTDLLECEDLCTCVGQTCRQYLSPHSIARVSTRVAFPARTRAAPETAQLLSRRSARSGLTTGGGVGGVAWKTNAFALGLNENGFAAAFNFVVLIRPASTRAGERERSGQPGAASGVETANGAGAIELPRTGSTTSAECRHRGGAYCELSRRAPGDRIEQVQAKQRTLAAQSEAPALNFCSHR
jgi:hypothetical protein